MNNYENAPACRMLASHCLICGRPLVDAISVSACVGPECRSRNGIDTGITEANRDAANVLIHRAAIAAQTGKIDEVMKLADEIETLGLTVLSEKVRTRFHEAAMKVEIEITESNGMYRIVTPFRRKFATEFVNAWRTVPGRRWVNGANVVPVECRLQVYSILQRFFGGKYGKGPKGLFRIAPAAPVAVQKEMVLA